MKRTSFLGNSVTELVSYRWPIPGLGEHNIGFGICEESGLVLQTTSVTPEEMLSYYAETATYVHQDNVGLPPKNKVADVKRQIEFLRQSTGTLPNGVLQVGSSDGYTLSQFREAGVEAVKGIEPGSRAREFAKTHYDVDSIAGSAESFSHDVEYDAIILTHILEHIYNPVNIIKKISNNLKDNGTLLIEVPLWECIDLLRVGVLTFEHVNYFCESSLARLLQLCGFRICDLAKHYYVNQYPVIIVTAKKSTSSETLNILPSYLQNRQLLEQYIKKEALFWLDRQQLILDRINENKNTFIYGGGIHTSQLLSNTNISQLHPIAGIIDSSSSKWDKKIGDLTINPPAIMDNFTTGTNVIISSAFSESNIYQFVKDKNPNINAIRLYG